MTEEEAIHILEIASGKEKRSTRISRYITKSNSNDISTSKIL